MRTIDLISLLTDISKVMLKELCIRRLDKFLTTSEIIYKFQFGFLKQYSTNHAFLSRQIRKALDGKMITCEVLLTSILLTL